MANDSHVDSARDRQGCPAERIDFFDPQRQRGLVPCLRCYRAGRLFAASGCRIGQQIPRVALHAESLGLIHPTVFSGDAECNQLIELVYAEDIRLSWVARFR